MNLQKSAPSSTARHTPCALCHAFLADILQQHYSNWNKHKLNPNCFAFRHADHHTMAASAAAGCRMCRLLLKLQHTHIDEFPRLGEKWQVVNAMVEVDTGGPPFVFELVTDAPNKSWIRFELFDPLDGAGLDVARTDSDSHLLPRELSTDPLSPRTIALARSWIEACEESHPRGERQDDPPLPRRVLDVNSGGEAADPRLHITNGQLGRYVTLSHCWGTGERLVTTTANLEEFQRAIPFAKLPKTFQDAITLVRKLGVRYLWIDALCIVQDDDVDWQRESAAMCAVYANGAFSISALAASDSNSGIFHAREFDQCFLSIANQQFGVRPQLDNLNEALEHSKLETRAWCLQERILSPAVLYVGPQQFFWECRTHVACESSARHAEVGTDARHSKSESSLADREQVLQRWYDLVSTYSARNLTKSTDRLPAIAGLADKTGSQLGGDAGYNYGLWMDHLTSGLLWRRPLKCDRQMIPNRDSHIPGANHIAQNRTVALPVDSIPSWSWASVSGRVEYIWPRANDGTAPAEPQIVSIRRPASGDKALSIDGCVKHGTCRALTPASGTLGNAGFKPSGSSSRIDSIACILDDIDQVIPKHCYCLQIARSMASTSRKSRGFSSTGKAYYLILERARDATDRGMRSISRGDDGTVPRFRRIGMGCDQQQKVEKVFANAVRRTLKLV